MSEISPVLDFHTGIIWQDLQHEMLIKQIANLKGAHQSGVDSKEFKSALDFLHAYISEHFGTEEAYMKKFDYPELDSHVKKHELFKRHLAKFEESIRKPSRSAAFILIDELLKWVKDHILTVDKELGLFLTDKGVDGSH